MLDVSVMDHAPGSKVETALEAMLPKLEALMASAS
jgi:hypothetical protein